MYAALYIVAFYVVVGMGHPNHHIDGHNIQPHPVLLSRLWATIQQAHIELHEGGALKR
jgi:hypothetical protein